MQLGKAFNDLFDKNPQLLGGATLKWQDQGIYDDREANHQITVYWGGFSAYPNAFTVFKWLRPRAFRAIPALFKTGNVKLPDTAIQ